MRTNKLILSIGIIISSIVGFAQLKTQDVFNKTELVWYGLDFSKSKFVGKFETIKGAKPINSYELINKYIPSWNEIIVNEPYNFDLENTFWEKNIYYDLSPVASVNSKIPTQDLITVNSNAIMSSDLTQMITNYKIGNKTNGLGLVFIVESFNKPKMLASVWVVFFDIETKKILLNKYCEGKPLGFGLRNYWAGSIKDILSHIRTRKFSQWSKENASLALRKKIN